MLYAYPMDLTACGHYRVLWPAQAMARQGFPTAKIVMPGEDTGVRIDLGPGPTKEVTGVHLPDDCTAVLLQRPTSEVLVDTIIHMQAKGIKVIVDIDDDLAAISPRHPSFRALHNTNTGVRGHTWKATERACAIADRVIASTPQLLDRYAPHGRSSLCRNALPPEVFTDGRPHITRASTPLATNQGSRGWLSTRQSPATAPEPVLPPNNTGPGPGLRVGWPGLLDTHPDDLTPASAALARLGLPMTIIGAEPLTPKRLLGGVSVGFTGPVQFSEWLPTIAKVLGDGRGIGIAPLEDSRFNFGKSAIKPLELAACGVACVVSATPEYLHLGIGIPASKPRQWHAHLARLARDEDLRASEIERNREIARKQVYDNFAESWFRAWHIW